MKRFLLSIFVAVLGLASLTIPADARVFVGVGFGGCCGFYPYYPAYNYGYSSYYYSAPPTVVYAQPPVTYVQPQVVTTAQPPSVSAPAPTAISAIEGSSTFVDSKGRTCRTFSSTLNNAPVNGTACLTADGTWHTVD